MAKISVILTVKDNETNLKECLNSLLKQTYKDIEVICLHDFDSRDILTQIVEAFAKADGRVIPFQTGLTGIADTKNSALDKVTGEYCYFIDSDDIITYPRLFEYAVTVFNNFDIDYFCFGANSNDDIKTSYNDGFNELDFETCLNAGTYMFNKILKVKNIKDFGVKFLDNSEHEEIFFMWNYHFILKAVYCEENVYITDKNPNTSSVEKYEDAIWIMRNWREIVNNLKEIRKLEQNYDNLIKLLNYITIETKKRVIAEEKYKVEKIKLMYKEELNEIILEIKKARQRAKQLEWESNREKERIVNTIPVEQIKQETPKQNYSKPQTIIEKIISGIKIIKR